MDNSTLTIIIVLGLLLFIVFRLIRIVPESYNYVIERLGVYTGIWGSGIHIKRPFIDRIARKVSLKEQVVDFPPQSVITKDNVTMQIDTIVFYQITDPKLFTYGVQYPVGAIENLAATTLRNIVGDLELDQTLTSRELINAKMQNTLDTATDPWGIKVNRVELKSITPPPSIMQAMELQMKAERDKRARILNATGAKEAQILEAEGRKQAMILNAEAERERMEIEATGKANAILKVQEATANGLRKIKEVSLSGELLQYKSLEALEKMGDGRATKIIIPSDLKNLAGTLVGLSETITSQEKPANTDEKPGQ